MKRWLCLILAACLAAGAFCLGLAEENSSGNPVPISEEGDDSEQVPVDAGDEDDSEQAPVDAGDEDDSEQVPVDAGDEDDPEQAGNGNEPMVSEETGLEDEVEEETVEARVLKYGDEGDDVLELQTRLRELKYYTGNLSGRYREGTREAVKAFQKDFEIDVTGVADMQTQALAYSTQYRPLRVGSTGDDVKALQVRLTDLGYYKGKNSGNYLEATQKAVRAFQERNRMEADGIADVDTQTVIFSGKAVGKNDAEATPVPTINLNDYLVDDEAENSDVIMPPESVPFTKRLKNGSSGKLVKALQERMTQLGYYDGPISGNFMVKTTRAVKKIQSQNAVKVTGLVDEETWNIIFNDPRIVLPENTPRPTPEPTPVPFAITVDVANQVTTVYGRDENGAYNVVVRQMLCSTGMKATPSDVGDWVLNGRNARWCYFPKWGSYARYWTRINSSIAFHSVIYNSVSTTNMAVKSYKKLGSRASHGCIRLTVADAKWIYDNVGAGTVVSIVEGMDPDPELRDALKLPPLNETYQTPVSTPEPTPEPEYRSAVKPDLEGKVLREKNESPAVYWVQRRLTELGYYRGKCSGKFLGGTKKALKAFQHDQHVYQSGEVDQKTLDLLFDAALPTPEPTPEPSATPAPEPSVAPPEN